MDRRRFISLTVSLHEEEETIRSRHWNESQLLLCFHSTDASQAHMFDSQHELGEQHEGKENEKEKRNEF